MVRADKGSIMNLGNGRWRIRVSGGHDPATGKRLRLDRTIRGTKKDALAERTRMLVEVGDIGHVRGSITFGDFIEDFYLPYKQRLVDQGKFRPNSYCRLSGNIRHHAKPLWNVQMIKISPYLMESCIFSIEGETARYSTYNDFKALWKKALTWGFVPRENDIFFSIDRPQPPKPEIVTADTRLLLKIFDTFKGHRCEPAVLVMAGCGLRCSEACSLDWESFDWDEGTVTITRSFHKVGKETMFLAPKTVESGATVSVPEFVLKRLREISHAEDGTPLLTGPIVLTKSNGKYERAYPQIVGKAYREYYRKALSSEVYVCIKNLRHSHATILLESGEDIALVSKRLRHARLSTTYNRYIKPGISADRHSSGVFNDALSSTVLDPNDQKQ